MQPLSIVVPVLALVVTALPAQVEWVVDQLNRPGTTHRVIQHAVTAASPGDRIVIRRVPNFLYAGFVLTEGVDVRGNYREFPEIAFAAVRNLPAGQSANLERMILRNWVQPCVHVDSCDGDVSLRQVFTEARALQSGPLPCVTIVDARRVFFEAGGLFSNQVTVCGVSRSSVVFRGVEMRGTLAIPFPEYNSEPCLVVESSDVVLHGCQLTGGAGHPALLDLFGNCVQHGTDGSEAIIAVASDVLLTGGTVLRAGAGGAGRGTCRSGQTPPTLLGSSYRVDPSVTILGGVNAQLRNIAEQPSLGSLPVVLDAGSSTDLELRGPASGNWTLFVDLAPGRIDLPGIEMPFLLTVGSLPILMGALPPTGVQTIPIATSNTPALIERVLWLQASTVQRSGEVRLSNVGSVRLR